MAVKLAIIVLVICDAVFLGNSIKPSTREDLDEEVEVFGRGLDDMNNKKREYAEQLHLRQDFLLKHQKEPDVEVFSNDDTQSEKLRKAAEADTVAIVINNINGEKRNVEEISYSKKEDADIPVVKGYGGLSESEVNQYLKPTKDIHMTPPPPNVPYNTRSGKGFINSHGFMPYQGPNIQYSQPYIECRPISAPYYSYNIGNDGYQQQNEWKHQGSNSLYYNTEAPQVSSSCDCSGNSEWKSSWVTPSNGPSLLYSRPITRVKPKVEIDGKLAQPLKPGK